MASLDTPPDLHNIIDSEDSADDNFNSSIRSKKRPNCDFERVNLDDIVVEGESLSAEEKEYIRTIRLTKKTKFGTGEKEPSSFFLARRERNRLNLNIGM